MKSACFTAVISSATALLLLSPPSGLLFVAAGTAVSVGPCVCDRRRLEDLFQWSDEVDELHQAKFEMLKNIENEQEEASNKYRYTAGADRLERSLDHLPVPDLPDFPETSKGRGRRMNPGKGSSSRAEIETEELCNCGIICPDTSVVYVGPETQYDCCKLQKKVSKSSEKSGTSKSRQKSGTTNEICGVLRGRRKLSIDDMNFASPVAPVGTEMIQLDNDPPVWMIPNFLSDPEVENLLNLIEKYGDELGHFERCLIDEKKCFEIKVDMMITKEDEEFLADIKNRFDNLWDFETLVNLNFLGVQKILPGAGPMPYHIDSMEVIGYPEDPVTGTNILYLTDNDPGIVFVNSVTVAPKRGMLLTWLNTDEKGTINMNSVHGVQANPKDGEERIMMHHHFTTSVVLDRLQNQEPGIENH